MNTTAYLATESGGFNELSSDFEILSIEDAATGEALNYTAPVTYAGINTSATAPTNLGKYLQDLSAALDNRTVTGTEGGLFGGFLGGDGFLPFVPGGTLVHVVILAVGAYLLLGRDGGGGTIVMGGGGSDG
jgi:hypothetical protein